MRRAMIAGTFDPITLGHTDLIFRAARLFDEVRVVVLDNCDKKSKFDSKQRYALACLACEECESVTVELWDGMLVDYYTERGIDVLVKGARNGVDFDYEYSLACINRSFDRRVETVILPAAQELSHISSTVVRELLKYGKTVSGYVPEACAAQTERMYKSGNDG